MGAPLTEWAFAQSAKLYTSQRTTLVAVFQNPAHDYVMYGAPASLANWWARLPQRLRLLLRRPVRHGGSHAVPKIRSVRALHVKVEVLGEVGGKLAQHGEARLPKACVGELLHQFSKAF